MARVTDYFYKSEAVCLDSLKNVVIVGQTKIFFTHSVTDRVFGLARKEMQLIHSEFDICQLRQGFENFNSYGRVKNKIKIRLRLSNVDQEQLEKL